MSRRGGRNRVGFDPASETPQRGSACSHQGGKWGLGGSASPAQQSPKPPSAAIAPRAGKESGAQVPGPSSSFDLE